MFYEHVESRLHDQTEAQIQKLRAREAERAEAAGDEDALDDRLGWLR